MGYVRIDDTYQVWSGWLCPECGGPISANPGGTCWCPECRWTGRLAECEAE